MHRVRARTARRVENAIDAEIALARRARTDGVRLVRVAHVRGQSIALRVDSDTGQAHFAARARDAHGNLAPIGYENLLQLSLFYRPTGGLAHSL